MSSRKTYVNIVNMPKYIFDSCTNDNNCSRCDIGYILRKYVKPLMQTLTVDIRDYYMKLLTTKCLNTAVMLAVFMLGKDKGIAIANYCDTEKTRYRHQQTKEDNNMSILKWFKEDILRKNITKHRYLYYILLTDGKFPFEDQSKPYAFFPGHVFIIEKFPSHDNKPTYYLYQSYINEYDLEGHVKRNKNTLKVDYDRLVKIVEGLVHIFNVDKWDDKCIESWKLLTFVDSSNMKDSICKGNFFLCIKKARVVDCLKNIELYTAKKLNEITPMVNTNKNQIYGDKSLYDERQTPLTVFQMYTKLKKLYTDVINRKLSLKSFKTQSTKNI